MDPEDQGNQPTGSPNDENLAILRDKASRTDKLERRLAMLEAGVDLTHPVGAMFAESGYTGELTTEAVKEAWEKVAPTPAAPPAAEDQGQPPAGEQPPATQGGPPPPQVSEDDLRRGIGTTPSTPPPPPEVDPVKAAWGTYHDDVARGTPKDTAAGAVIGAMIGAAESGDERYIWNGEWTEEDLAKQRTTRT